MMSSCTQRAVPFDILGPRVISHLCSRPLVQSIRPTRPCSQPPIKIEALCPFLRAHLQSRPFVRAFQFEASARTLHFNVSSTTSLIIFCFSHTLFPFTYNLWSYTIYSVKKKWQIRLSFFLFFFFRVTGKCIPKAFFLRLRYPSKNLMPPSFSSAETHIVKSMYFCLFT